MRIGDALFGALICLLGIGVLWHSAGFAAISRQFYGPSLFPSIIGWGFVVTGILLAGAAIGRRGALTGLISFPDWRGSPRGVIGVALMLLAVLAFIRFGDTIGFHILAFATLTLLYFTAARSVPQSVGIALAVALLVPITFQLGPLAAIASIVAASAMARYTPAMSRARCCAFPAPLRRPLTSKSLTS